MKIVTESKVFKNKENLLQIKNFKNHTEKKRVFGKELQNVTTKMTTPKKKTPKCEKKKEIYKNRLTSIGLKVPAYEKLIFNFIKKNQKKVNKNSNYMTTQKDINEKMRAILVDWLVDVTEKFQMAPQSLFMTVDLLDRYLSKKQMERSKLQLLGITCLMIIGKYEEIYPPLLKDYIAVCDNAFENKEILKMEAEVLSTLNFLVERSCSFIFLEHLEEKIGLKKKPLFFVKYILENSLVMMKCLKFSSLELVLGAVFLVKKIFKIGGWDEKLGEIADVSEIKTKICARDLYMMMKEMDNSELTAIKRKFAQPDFLEVSKFKIEKKNN